MNYLVAIKKLATGKRLMLSTVAVCTALLGVNAHAVNCNGVAAWNSGAIYKDPGANVQSAGKAYVNKWWTQGENPANSGEWGVWKLLGNCDGATSSSKSSAVSSSKSSVASSSKASVSSSKSSAPSSKSSSSSSSLAGNDCGATWYKANLTNYESYPDPGSEECIKFNGCTWAGQFYGLPDKMSESWVQANNIAAIHLKDWSWMGLKTINLRQGTKRITAKVYDGCSDSDCDGCCTQNLGGDGYLVDLEKYTMQRFGSGSGTVEFQICN